MGPLATDDLIFTSIQSGAFSAASPEYLRQNVPTGDMDVYEAPSGHIDDLRPAQGHVNPRWPRWLSCADTAGCKGCCRCSCEALLGMGEEVSTFCHRALLGPLHVAQFVNPLVWEHDRANVRKPRAF